MEVRHVIYSEEIRCFIKQHHYTNAYPLTVRHAFGLFDKDRLIGVCTFSNMSRLEVAKKFPYNLELSRLVVVDEAPRNTESFFISRCLKWIKKNDHQIVAVLAYSDTTQGHLGTVYKASNFEFAGSTRESYHYEDSEGVRFHKRNIYRKAVKLGLKEHSFAKQSGLMKVKETVKLRFRYFLRDRQAVSIYGEIYKISNTVSDKLYIGQTIYGIKHRFRRHLADAKIGSTLPLHEAIRAFGSEKFSVELVDTASNPYDLDDKEAHYIDLYNSRVDGNGYNVEDGYGADCYRVPDNVLLTTFKLRSEGLKLAEIAERVGLNKDYISKIHNGALRTHLKEIWDAEHGPLPPLRVMSEDEKFKIFTLRYNENRTLYEIAEILRTSAAYVGLVLSGKLNGYVKEAWDKEHGTTKTRHMLYLTAEQVAKCMELVFVQGSSIKEASIALGLSYDRVQRLVLGEYFLEEKERFFAQHPGVSRIYEPRIKVTDEVLLKCFEERSQGSTIAEVGRKFDVNPVWLSFVFRGKSRPDLLDRWNGEAVEFRAKAPVKVTEKLLFDCFRDRVNGSSLDELAFKYDLNKSWLSEVFNGRERPEVLAKWIISGGQDFKSLSKGNSARGAIEKCGKPVISSDGREFASAREAAKHYEVSDALIRKNIKNNKPVKGVMLEWKRK